MQLSEVVGLLRDLREREQLEAWPGYRVQDIPYAVYSKTAVLYFGHPHPPAQRPQNLVTSTTVKINGVQTATIPVAMCRNPETVLRLVYHEGFHVFQQQNFAPIRPELSLAMAFYPELDVNYRALCSMEIVILRDTERTTEEKLGILGKLTRLRRDILSRHPSLIQYERFLERNEGTAVYVEQIAREKLYDVPPRRPQYAHDWRRFYDVGAAFCALLDEVSSNWTDRIEAGDSPGDLVMEWEDPTVSVNKLGFRSIRSREAFTLKRFRDQFMRLLIQLTEPDILRIRYDAAKEVYRAFKPSTLVSMGDGRVLHQDSFQLIFPDNGSIRVQGTACIDYVAAQELILPMVGVRLEGDTLTANTAHIQIELTDIQQEYRHIYSLITEYEGLSGNVPQEDSSEGEAIHQKNILTEEAWARTTLVEQTPNGTEEANSHSPAAQI